MKRDSYKRRQAFLEEPLSRWMLLGFLPWRVTFASYWKGNAMLQCYASLPVF